MTRAEEVVVELIKAFEAKRVRANKRYTEVLKELPAARRELAALKCPSKIRRDETTNQALRRERSTVKYRILGLEREEIAVGRLAHDLNGMADVMRYHARSVIPRIDILVPYG